MGLGCVKCDLWLVGSGYGGWVFVGCGMGGRFVVVVGLWSLTSMAKIEPCDFTIVAALRNAS